MDPTHPPQRLGRYALYDKIASGGMATVYFGQLVGTAGFSRIVAVKRLHPHLTEEKDFASMLLDEAYLAGRIRHPNVVPTLDVVATEKELLVVMEYVHGETLARLMKTATSEGKPIPVEIAGAVVVGMLNGLHAAHETTNEQGEPLQIVHRDISPQNVVVGVDGIPRLLDFGVAKAQHRLNTTQDGQIKGKLAYMAVEQLTNQRIDRRADVYGAGVILWELLTGRRLFAGETESSTMHIILTGTHPKPSSVVPGIPAALDAVTMRALSRNPSSRYDTAKQMALALEQCVRVASITAVGEWVAGMAEAQLTQRARTMRAIEAQQGARSRELGVPMPSTDIEIEMSVVQSGAHAVDTSSGSAAPIVPARRGWLLGVLGAAAVAAVLAIVLLTTSASKSAANAPSTPSPGTSASAATSPAPSASAPAEVASAAASVSSSAPSPSAKASAQASQGTVPSRPHTTPHPPVPRTPKVDCNPPYTIDDIGVRHYKPECSR